jgi:hypothetical protein
MKTRNFGLFNLATTEGYDTYRPRNLRFHERYIHPVTNSGRFSVKVWGWISVHGMLENAAVHYRDILENIMLPSHSADLS